MFKERVDELKSEACEIMEEEKTEEKETEEFNPSITEALNIIATHIMLCADELKRAGFNIEDFEY